MPIYYESGETIDSAQGLYSRSGNPAVYYKLSGKKFAFDWDADGNLINAYLPPTMQPVSFTYDSNGLRTSKSGGSHRYYYAGGRLLRDTYGDTVLDFCYDESGRPFSLIYKKGSVSTTYYYITNLQGDVIKLVDTSGNTVAEYAYDPYGKILSATGDMAEINPLRYRGYYYDEDLGFYYLQSRYYDPEIGRFISADSYASTGQGFTGQNMFAYCGNNPVVRKDDGGEFWHIIAGAVVGAAVSFTSSVIGNIISGEEVDWAGAGISAAFGAVSGALAASGLGAVAQVAGGAVLAGGENVISQGRDKGFDNIDYGEVAVTSVIGGISSRSNGLSKSTSKHLKKQATAATKRIASSFKHDGLKVAGQTIKKAGKYYLSQTSTLFYKPLLKDATSSLFGSVRKSLAKSMAVTVS